MQILVSLNHAPSIVRRGSHKYVIPCTAKADGSILYDPTKVVTHEKLSGRRHETIGGCSKLRKAETPSISRHLHIHNVLPCMTCREDKFWVIFVGPMVLPRLDISYNNCSKNFSASEIALEQLLSQPLTRFR